MLKDPDLQAAQKSLRRGRSLFVFVPRVRKTITITYHEHDWRAKGLNETK